MLWFTSLAITTAVLSKQSELIRMTDIKLNELSENWNQI